MRRLILALGAVLMLSAAAEAAPFRGSIEKGPVDNSLFCPPGSGWYPIQEGVCLSCPNGKKPKAGICPGLVTKTKFGKFSYNRKFMAGICKPGTYRRPKTKECWTCGKGYVRIPGKKFNAKAHMCVSIKPQIQKAKVVEKVNLEQLLDPKRLKREFADRGCKGYGRSAFYSLKGGGTCMVCPSSHPKRTKWPASSNKACATKTCGGNGERICDILAGEGAPCARDHQINLVSGLCEPKRNIACKPFVGALKGMYTGIQKAKDATGNVKIPGMDVLKAFMSKITDKVDGMAMGMLAKLPTGKIRADIKRIFGDQKNVRAMAAVAEEVSARRGKLTRMILDAETSCVNTAALEREMMEILRGASRAEAPGSGAILAELLGVRPAQASVPPFFRGKSIGVTVGGLVNKTITRLGLHTNYAVEAVWSVNDAGTGVDFSLYALVGADFLHSPVPHPVGEPGFWIGFGGFGRGGCNAPYGLQLGAGKILGGAVNHCGLVGVSLNLANVDLGQKTPAINLLTAEGITKSLLPAGKTPAEIERARAGKGGVLGFNFAFRMAGKKGQSLLAP